MMKNISAGDLRHRVVLLRDQGTTPNTVGQVKPIYVPVGTYYALVECLGGAEGANANQLKGTLNYKVTFRAAAGPIRPTDQLTWNGHTLNVATATTDPFGIMIEVEATEKVTQ
jgi:head-tail adaptor